MSLESETLEMLNDGNLRETPKLEAEFKNRLPSARS
jgi:hypothetical protein